MGCASESVKAVDDVLLNALHVFLGQRVDALWQWEKRGGFSRLWIGDGLVKAAKERTPGADRRVQVSMESKDRLNVSRPKG